MKSRNRPPLLTESGRQGKTRFAESRELSSSSERNCSCATVVSFTVYCQHRQLPETRKIPNLAPSAEIAALGRTVITPNYEDLEESIDRAGRSPAARHHRLCDRLPEPEKPGHGPDRKSAEAEPGLGGQCFR